MSAASENNFDITWVNNSKEMALKSRASADTYWLDSLVEVALTTGLIAPLGTTGYPVAVFAGIVQVAEINTSSSQKRIPLVTEGRVALNLSITDLTAQTQLGKPVYATTSYAGKSGGEAGDLTMTHAIGATPVGYLLAYVSGTRGDLMFFRTREIILAIGAGGQGRTGADKKIVTAVTGDGVITAAQLLGGMLTLSKTSALALTTDTGTNIAAAAPGMIIGDWFDVTMTNIDTNAGGDCTITAGGGVTAVGNVVIASNNAVTDQSAATFRFLMTAANTFLMYRAA